MKNTTKERLFIATATAILLTLILFSQIFAVPAKAAQTEFDPAVKTDMEYIDPFKYPDAAEGEHIEIIGTVKEEPSLENEDTVFVSVMTEKGNRLIIVLPDKNLVYHTGYPIHATGEIAGVVTTHDGARVPLLDAVTLYPVENASH